MPVKLRGAGDFDLEVLTLITVSGMEIDLTASCIGITIYEDIFSLALTGTIMLGDSFNLPSHGPILGQEYLKLKIKTPTLPDTPATIIDFTENVFLVHAISARQRLTEGVQAYTLEFASQEIIKNQRLKVTQRLEGTWSDLAEQMLRDEKYLNTKKNIVLEKTAGVKNFVAPNIRPLDVVVLAAKQAISQKRGDPTYLFYETFDGFHFRSLSSLYNEIPSFYFTTVVAGLNPPFGFNYDIIKHMKTILSYDIVHNNDTVKGYRAGMYGSMLHTHDVINKKYDTHVYNYHDNFTRESHIVSGTTAKRTEYPFVSELQVNKKGRVSDFPARTFVMPETNSSLDSTKDSQHITTASTTPYSSYNPQGWAQRRNSQMLQLENAFNINMTVHGNTLVRAGNIVTVNIPNVQATTIKDEDSIDRFYNGPFLVKRIRHEFSRMQSPSKHTMHMALVKDSLEEELPNPTNNMERSSDTDGNRIYYEYS